MRFDHATGHFFLLSAIFHLFPVLVGGFDRLAFIYWKQIDNAFLLGGAMRPIRPFRTQLSDAR